jgi:hypothetical protein
VREARGKMRRRYTGVIITQIGQGTHVEVCQDCQSLFLLLESFKKLTFVKNLQTKHKIGELLW